MTSAVGDVVLVRMPKLRPALVLGLLPGPFQSLLVCGISTDRVHEFTADWDEALGPGDPEFEQTGLHRASIARLSFVFSVTEDQVAGVVGSLPPEKVRAMQVRLAQHLLKAASDAT